MNAIGSPTTRAATVVWNAVANALQLQTEVSRNTVIAEINRMQDAHHSLVTQQRLLVTGLAASTLVTFGAIYFTDAFNQAMRYFGLQDNPAPSYTTLSDLSCSPSDEPSACNQALKKCEEKRASLLKSAKELRSERDNAMEDWKACLNGLNKNQ
ncbi:MAG: hypothetical protein FJZ64_00110 [Chlamydiae bacterium]|nr:hypothetical protein [Chlamydiota bacterium]